MRRVYSASVILDAPVHAVWAVLVDFARYPDWNPFTIEVKTSLEVGTPIDMKVRMAKLGLTLWQRETVREVVPNARLVWGTRMLGGVIVAERTQILESMDDGKTRYRTEDVIEGPLAPLVFVMFGPSVQAGFDGVAAALPARLAETR